ncbi:MAG: methylenetetrahydrofolate--tRNA-(uracil(54)-C(5))-methyltransferase (FADH(2)-oxidizing) TrmFO [Candidatus Latescibacterota bacterium]|nr:MAG: methylenetetrahydrofolate--tRNA-(uracil(54)-C(5))-methyltransferase (FADH(2)-oxidizing) TrmFO [Candidatus Latescibacterota bacterium]
MKRVLIVGGGLSGCEAAWQLADRGVDVHLLEMRPKNPTEAHRTGDLAEIVCSNSFKSTLVQTASGLLKAEVDILGCRLLKTARDSAVPAGHALAVDRGLFAQTVTAALEASPRVAVERKRQDDLDVTLPAIIATGPLTAVELSKALEHRCSSDHLYFYDAIAPSVEADSIDPNVGYYASRYDKGGADYLNIPLTKEEYERLITRIRAAQLVEPHAFEERKYFEACLPIEVMVERGEDTPRFGPLRPIGLPDPRTGVEPYAVIQLRQETRSGTLLGLVGFQTRMTYPAQQEVIRSLPGFDRARILRYGSIHRNIFLNIPALCDPYQRDRKSRGLFYAGQICGVEGYVECISSGLVAALAVFADLCERAIPELPEETMIGSLMNHIHTPCDDFQPMNANMGILPAQGNRKGGRSIRYREAAERAVSAMRRYREANPWLFESRLR